MGAEQGGKLMTEIRIRCQLRALKAWHALEVRTMLRPDPLDRTRPTRQAVRAEVRFRCAMLGITGGLAE